MAEKGIRKKGQFLPGQSGNPAGRPKGSKNQISLVKLMAEQAVREKNFDKMQEVCNLIIEQATKGDKSSQKLVWEAVLSRGVAETNVASDKVEIKIGSFAPEEPKPIDAEVVVTQEEETQNEAEQ